MKTKTDAVEARAYAVIGAGYGDEGKGLLTDYLSTPETLVVRFNGGAQAGHTVVTPEERRHVFKHIGAGTFRGASTLLSRFFIVNPILFLQERPAFPNARIYVDPRAMVTTPYDMLLNRAGEKIQQHGSVGLGINETVTRHLDGIALTVETLMGSEEELRRILRVIHHDYYPARAAQLGVSTGPDKRYVERFILDVEQFVNEIRVVEDIDVLRRQRHVVFEGAQGLRLDEYAAEFPHVTRSRTGSTNVIMLCREADIEKIDVHYVTRAYRTRHGNGPLPGELRGHPFGWSGPETNTDHEYQGKFRYAKLNLDVLTQDIAVDVARWARSTTRVSPHVAVTCLDQLPPYKAVLLREDVKRAAAVYGVKAGYASFGPTREHVKTLDVPSFTFLSR